MIFSQNSEKIKKVPVIQIEPKRSQPRRNFSKMELKGLSDSIKENGVIQPISVRKVFASKFELIAGERRLRAAIMAGLKTVPCLILECDETQAAIFALVENLQRSELDFFEEAEAIQRLIENWGITQDLIAQKLGKNLSTIANKLRLLMFSEVERKQIVNAGLTEKHARALLRLDNVDQRWVVLNKIILKRLNVQDTEFLIDSVLNNNFDNFIEFDLNGVIEEINKVMDLIKISNLKTEHSQKKTEKYIEYVIRIPKVNVKKTFESV